MTLYTPPDKPSSVKKAPPGSGDTAESDKSGRFYVRPSLGLKMWGPLVPASDNRTGLWSLIACQTGFGLFFLWRFRGLQKASRMNKIIKKKIAEIPSLNVFSKSDGLVYVPKKTLGVTNGATLPINKLPNLNQMAHLNLAAQNTGKSKTQGRWTYFVSNMATFRNYLYLFTGTVILFQSALEVSRLTLLPYDPWYEEARSARDKKFFNDTVQFYHEGIDPTKIKVKDASSGNALSTNIPQVKQSVALVRAQSEAENSLIKWYGPIEFKPMSFTEYLDRIEYFMDTTESIQAKRKSSILSKTLQAKVAPSEEEIMHIIETNQENKNKINGTVFGKITKSEITTHLPVDHEQSFPLRSVILAQEVKQPEEVNLVDMWTLYNPWMSLALDTSLSIKFLPTVVGNQEEPEELNWSSNMAIEPHDNEPAAKTPKTPSKSSEDTQ